MKKISKRYDKPGKWEVVIPFAKKGEEKEWKGVIDARHAGEYELRVRAEHVVGQTKGKIIVRAVAGKDTVLKIFGMIKIYKKAQETEDFLELRVLTLDQTAKVVVLPELEIEANNVKASHAASVGMVDQDQLRYLRSRGLREKEAQEKLIEGWLGV